MLFVMVGAQKTPTTTPPPNGGGFLAEIKVEDYDDKWRADYNKATRVLFINTKHPLLRQHAQASRASKGKYPRYTWGWIAVVADSVTEALFRRVISDYIEEKGRIPRNESWDPTMDELDSLWYSHSARIHRLVETKLMEGSLRPQHREEQNAGA